MQDEAEGLKRGILSVEEKKKGLRRGWTRIRKPRWFFLGQIKSGAIPEASRCCTVTVDEWGWFYARVEFPPRTVLPRGVLGWRNKERSDGKNDNNKLAREAGNNNRESASGTRPKGKNVRPFASEEIVFLASGRCCASYTVVLDVGRWYLFFFLFLSLRYSSRGARAGEECSEGLKAPDLQVGELRGYRRSRCYPLCLYSLECPFSFYLISIVTKLYNCTMEVL